MREAIEGVRGWEACSPPPELRAMGRMLGAAAGPAPRSSGSRRAAVPTLFDACSTDPTLDELADAISTSFEPDGTLADRASARLRELRSEWHAARQRMLSRMEDLMQRYEPVLQDRFVTEREGRWVLPVRSDAHERFPGIVHATSSSGATLFVEPRAVVPMGNRLKVLEADVRREEEAQVYARLTALIADQLPSVEAAANALAIADVRGATARLAHDVALTFPTLVDEPALALKRARHLLLALDTPSGVVPSDLTLQAGRAIVVSGPNAGGKTVALKTMGLVALMVRAGMPVPCDEGSTVGLFDVVLTDVGDDQSLQKNLSTFSAHVSNLTEILKETTRGALVLLDELAGGTDPREGEALAAGVLDSLCARGGAVAVTTHTTRASGGAPLFADDRFENASVGFDRATMAPTFRLAMGIPGSSSALAVARRFGMPSTVIERAERFLTREDRSFESVVKKLNDERAALELARAAAEKREAEAHHAKTRLEAEIESARSREKRFLGEEARELMERVRRAREDLREAQAKLRTKKADAEVVREAERAIDRVAGEVAIGGPLAGLVSDVEEAPREALRATELRKGARVWVPKLRAEAEIVDVLGGDHVRVAAGALKLTVAASELRSVVPPAPPSRPTSSGGVPRGAPLRAASVHEPAIPTRDSTCDLRGLRVEDALSMATSFLDRALGEGMRIAFLIHGHGTGALRDAIRKGSSRGTRPTSAGFRSAEADPRAARV